MSPLQIFGLLLLGGLIMYGVLYMLLRIADGSMRPAGRESAHPSAPYPRDDAQRMVTEDGDFEAVVRHPSQSGTALPP